MKTKIYLLACLAAFFVSYGCAPLPSVDVSKDVREFEAGLENLFVQLAHRAQGLDGVLPVVVMPGSYRRAGASSRLEERIITWLETKLAEKTEVVRIRERDMWHSFREGSPLRFEGDRQLLQVFQVIVEEDLPLDRITVRIEVSDAEGRRLPGLVATTAFSASHGTAACLQRLPGRYTTLPLGLAETPFPTVESMVQSLSMELSREYRKFIQVEGRRPDDDEVRLFLLSEPKRGIGSPLEEEVLGSLQQALVENGQFNVDANERDLARIYQVEEIYRRQKKIEMEEQSLEAGTVIVVVDFSFQEDKGTLAVALRALWRVSPLLDEDGSFFIANQSGRYIGGFAAKAFARGSKDAISKAVLARRSSKLSELGIFFVGFPSSMAKRIEPTLRSDKRVVGVEARDNCRSGSCYYQVTYDGKSSDVIAFMEENLRTSGVLAFDSNLKGNGDVEFLFNGGF